MKLLGINIFFNFIYFKHGRLHSVNNFLKKYFGEEGYYRNFNFFNYRNKWLKAIITNAKYLFYTYILYRIYRKLIL